MNLLFIADLHSVTQIKDEQHYEPPIAQQQLGWLAD
jgi:hypothetical protein